MKNTSGETEILKKIQNLVNEFNEKVKIGNELGTKNIESLNPEECFNYYLERYNNLQRTIELIEEKEELSVEIQKKITNKEFEKQLIPKLKEFLSSNWKKELANFKKLRSMAINMLINLLSQKLMFNSLENLPECANELIEVYTEIGRVSALEHKLQRKLAWNNLEELKKQLVEYRKIIISYNELKGKIIDIEKKYSEKCGEKQRNFIKDTKQEILNYFSIASNNSNEITTMIFNVEIKKQEENLKEHERKFEIQKNIFETQEQKFNIHTEMLNNQEKIYNEQKKEIESQNDNFEIQKKELLEQKQKLENHDKDLLRTMAIFFSIFTMIAGNVSIIFKASDSLNIFNFLAVVLIVNSTIVLAIRSLFYVLEDKEKVVKVKNKEIPITLFIVIIGLTLGVLLLIFGLPINIINEIKK